MSTQHSYFLKGLQVLAWVLFIGLCVEAGGIIVNAIISLFFHPEASSRFWGGLNLYGLYLFNQSHFVTLVILLSLVAVLKSILFYLIVDLFHQKKVDFAFPFNEMLGKYLFNLSYLAFGIGLFSYWGSQFAKKILLESNYNDLNLQGADIWIFMGFILIIFALIFKKGLEIQKENELTI
ncbi:MAG: hypothetical protein ACK5SQ_02070 [Chitinophagales bacterium]|jgi:hypothetical protein